MNNRGEVKWQPFNAVVPASEVLQELKEKRNQQKLPILSEDDKENLEQNIQKAYHTKEKIQIIYFWKNQFYRKLGIIDHFNFQNKQIYFDDHTSLYFEQITKISFLN